MIKKIIAAASALALTMVLLASCGNAVASAQVTDYGDVEGYYSDLTYEVRNDDGVVTEQMYFLCNDEACENIVGKKSVYFDSETGKMNRYTVTIGMLMVQEVYSYTSGEGGDFYSEMYFNSDQILERGTWDNNYTDEDGAEIRETGEQTYYSDGTTVKTFILYKYKDGELVETVTREYDEDGNVTSEEIK